MRAPKSFIIKIISTDDLLIHRPWILLEVGPETQSNVVVFDHSLHVACLSIDICIGPLSPEKNTTQDHKSEKNITECLHLIFDVAKGQKSIRHPVILDCECCTLRISSVVSWCFMWISSCRFMRSSRYIWTSCESAASLSRSSSSSTTYNGQKEFEHYSVENNNVLGDHLKTDLYPHS